jgi:hypothetical protein
MRALCKGCRLISGVMMGVQLYLSAGLVGLVWLVWIAINYHGRESMRMAREVDDRLRKSAELLSTIPGSLRR